jgi:hypothetical protein
VRPDGRKLGHWRHGPKGDIGLPALTSSSLSLPGCHEWTGFLCKCSCHDGLCCPSLRHQLVINRNFQNCEPKLIFPVYKFTSDICYSDRKLAGTKIERLYFLNLF